LQRFRHFPLLATAILHHTFRKLPPRQARKVGSKLRNRADHMIMLVNQSFSFRRFRFANYFLHSAFPHFRKLPIPTLYSVWFFRPFAVSPPGFFRSLVLSPLADSPLADSPPRFGLFAFWLVRPLAHSLPGLFAPCLILPLSLDDSSPLSTGNSISSSTRAKNCYRLC